MSDIDHEDTSKPVCPHCGHKDDEWYVDMHEGIHPGFKWEQTCPSCDEDYEIEVTEVDPTFTTTKAEPKPEPEEKEPEGPPSATLTQSQLRWLGEKLYGKHGRDWKFRCPMCKRNTTTAEWREENHVSEEEACRLVMQECVMRRVSVKYRLTKEQGRCDWCAYGLFSGPWFVVADDINPDKRDQEVECMAMFPLADATQELIDEAKKTVPWSEKSRQEVEKEGG